MGTWKEEIIEVQQIKLLFPSDVVFIEGIPSLPAGFYDVKEFVITISSTSSSSSVLYPTLLCIRLLFSPSLRLFFCP